MRFVPIFNEFLTFLVVFLRLNYKYRMAFVMTPVHESTFSFINYSETMQERVELKRETLCFLLAEAF